MTALEKLADLYAEDYGIIEYKIKGNLMIYYTNWSSERSTYKVIVNLDKMKEVNRIRLKKYYKKGCYNYCK